MSKDAKIIIFPSAIATVGSMLPKKSLDTLSNQALCELRDEIDKEIKKRAESLQRTIDRLVSVDTGHRRGPRKGQKVAPKYQGPHGEKWSGRGLKPRWLTAAINEGEQLEDFLIGKPKKKKDKLQLLGPA